MTFWVCHFTEIGVLSPFQPSKNHDKKATSANTGINTFDSDV